MSRCESLSAMPPSTAAEGLATLIERQLGLPTRTIDPVAFRLFLVAYWDRVRMYAHAVHDNQEPTHNPTGIVVIAGALGHTRVVPPAFGAVSSSALDVTITD